MTTAEPQARPDPSDPSDPSDPPRSPLLDRAAAVPAEGADLGVAWHYGDPHREQRQLVAGLAVVDQSHRGVLRITGADRLSWLHSLTSQRLSDLSPGTSTETLLLSPHGHIEHVMQVVDDGEATWLTVERSSRAVLLDWLDRMRFMLRVEVTEVTADWAVLAAAVPVGAPLPEPLADLLDGVGDLPPAWQDPWPAVAPGSVSYAAVELEDHPGRNRSWREVLVPRRLLERAGGLALAGTWAAQAERVAAWRPRLNAETDHRTIPHEVDWLRTAVHLTKGCYRGQETVARVHNLGRPPRRLVFLHLDGSGHELPAASAQVLFGERPVGRIGTAVRHHELGPIALAVVKRSTPVDAVLSTQGIPASQEVIVAG
jgi:folate-binding protein YgfZ